MCDRPAHLKDRRNFLRLAAVSTGATLLAGALPSLAYATPAPTERPKPANDLSPQLALQRLMEGNQRYTNGVTSRHNFMHERELLVNGQNPFVAVLSCADSRIAPEYTFDTALGDLFAVRVAGNFVTDNGLASLEYAVAVLGTPLIMVLGHDMCGAVAAGVKAVKDNARFPGKIQGLADTFKPSVNKVLKAPGDLLENAIAQNVTDTMARLMAESSLLADAVATGKLLIVGGVYKLHSGKVKMLG